MAMNANVPNMNAMGGPVGGAPMPMMNNGAVNHQAAAVAAAAAAARQQQHSQQQQQQQQQQQANDSQRSILNTYIYDYFLRYNMYDCARALLTSDQQVNVNKEGGRRRDENGNVLNGIDDSMDTDSKDDMESKLPEDLPPPKLPLLVSDTSFLYEWFSLFWDISNAQRAKGVNGTINQYVAHTQQQSRMKQNQQQEILRHMRTGAELTPQQQFAMMRSMQQNGAMGMNMNKGNPIARTAMANNQNPQMQMMQQGKNPMQRDPSGMNANQDRPSSPASGENAPSPSKRQRMGDAPGFIPAQAGAMAGRPGQMGGMPVPNNATAAAAHQLLTSHGINPNHLTPQQFQNFVNSPDPAKQKSIATYSQNLQQHHGTQMGNNKMPPGGGPQGQGSPMIPQGPDGTALAAFYNPNEMGGPAGIRPGPGGGAQVAPGSSNHALQDYQMQLMLLEQQNKKRLMMARQEQDTIGGMPREAGAPGAPAGAPDPNGQAFPEASPQAMRTGASPNSAEQMKRGTPQMNNSGMPSPVPEGGQSRGSPNPNMNFMGGHVDPNMAGPPFMKGMEGPMAGQPGMAGMRPPSSHPGGQPFNGQMNAQMMAARQQQGGQPMAGPQPQPGQQAGQGTPQQWTQGPNGQMIPQAMQQSPQIQGTPQQRAMPPPAGPPAAGANANSRTTASPQQPAAAPPTPSQTKKTASKKKDTKSAKDKKNNQNANAGATPAGEINADQETPAPATPITPANAGNFKNGQAGNATVNGQPTSGPAPASAAPAAAAVSAPPAALVPPPGQADPSQNGGMGMNDFDFGSMDLANPLQTTDVLNDFDFDSFLHDGDDNNQPFEFGNSFGIQDSEIGAE